MLRNVKRWTAVAALTAVVAAAAWAAAVDGKYTWMQRGQGGNEVAVVLELKADDKGVLTGSLTRGEMKSPIEKGTFKDSVVAFVTIRERDGQKFETQYNGKLDGDKIVGTIKSMRGGQDRTNEWTATRAK